IRSAALAGAVRRVVGLVTLRRGATRLTRAGLAAGTVAAGVVRVRRTVRFAVVRVFLRARAGALAGLILLPGFGAGAGLLLRRAVVSVRVLLRVLRRCVLGVGRLRAARIV